MALIMMKTYSEHDIILEGKDINIQEIIDLLEYLRSLKIGFTVIVSPIYDT